MRALIVLLLLAQSPVSIRVSAPTIFADQSLRITCRVLPDAENRSVTIELVDYALSERPLTATGPITTDVWFHHIPCGIDTARCSVTRARRTLTSTATITVIGC